ncbi:hypothetical protein ACFL52_01290 [Candidatus Margulisiibacteriota bacterium]
MKKDWPLLRRYIQLGIPYWDKSIISLISIGITVLLGMALQVYFGEAEIIGPESSFANREEIKELPAALLA